MSYTITIIDPKDCPVYKLDIEDKYMHVHTDNQNFKDLFDLSKLNMDYFFSAYLNTKDKVSEHLKEKNKKLVDISVYKAPDKDDATEYSDVKNRNNTVYNDFFENYVRKAHLRQGIAFCNYIPAINKKADLVFCDFFENQKMSFTYMAKSIMMCLDFSKNGVKMVYMLNHSDTDKMMLDINIAHNNTIVEAEVYFNFTSKRSNETDIIAMSHKQLDYLIILGHYADSEEIDFIAEKYVDDILAEKYEDFLNYIKIKEMIYI